MADADYTCATTGMVKGADGKTVSTAGGSGAGTSANGAMTGNGRGPSTGAIIAIAAGAATVLLVAAAYGFRAYRKGRDPSGSSSAGA